MTRKLFSALLSSALIFPAMPVSSAEGVRKTSPGTKLEWPDYKSNSWSVAVESQWGVDVNVPVKNNKYIPGPARYNVLVGPVRIFVDSLKNPTLAITEAEVLDKGPVIRIMEIPGVGVLARQIKNGNEWKDLPPDAVLYVDVMEFDKLLATGEMKGVVIRLVDGNKEVMKLVMENSPPAKSKK